MQQPTIELVSFGYKHGPPSETIKNFNVRKFPNPPSAMRKSRTGLNKELSQQLFSIAKAEELYQALKAEILDFIQERNISDGSTQESDLSDDSKEEEKPPQEEPLPISDSEEPDDDELIEKINNRLHFDSDEDDDQALKIGIGCHSGKHRSVAIIERFKLELVQYDVRCYHRDIDKTQSKPTKSNRRERKGDPINMED
eukprot:TRINITY_DN3731_c0_g1_i2.p1 TRINITY_DN3731_c0_g1~~TRINITY_DN3731_c0_g1_i2.p1  ORF type:complete len:198 (-),score=56.45 TRINITY_DN3731_c0_g1_i2:131-724(-)